MKIIDEAVEFLKSHEGESFYPAQLVAMLNLKCFDSSLSSSLRRRYRYQEFGFPWTKRLRKEEKELQRGGTAVAYY